MLRRTCLYLFMLLSALTVGCSRDEQFDEVQSRPEPFVVGGYVSTLNATRTAPEGEQTLSSLRDVDFGLFVYATTERYKTASASGLAPDFMYNQRVTWDDVNEQWTYTPQKYWPPVNYGLTILAYAPYTNTTHDSQAAIGVAGSGDAHDGRNALLNGTSASTDEPTITYQRDMTLRSIDEQVDLLWGVSGEGLPYIDQLRPAESQPVAILFKHALAKVGFRYVRSDAAPALKLKSLRMSARFYTKGDLNLHNTSRHTPLWKNLTLRESAANFDWTPDAVIPTTEAAVATTSEMLFLPQQFSSEVPLNFTLVYEDSGGTEQTVGPIAITDLNLEGNHLYNFVIRQLEPHYIAFGVQTIGEWGLETEDVAEQTLAVVDTDRGSIPADAFVPRRHNTLTTTAHE